MYNGNPSHYNQLQHLNRHKPQPKQSQTINNLSIPQLQHMISRNRSNNNTNDNRNSIRSSGAVYPSQTKRISVPISITNNKNNNNNNNKATTTIQRDIQRQLQRHKNCCFVTTKSITVKGRKVPAGHAGKIVLSREFMGKYCCIFGLPYDNIEVVVNPATHLIFGMNLMS